jgi:hypothetical protein
MTMLDFLVGAFLLAVFACGFVVGRFTGRPKGITSLSLNDPPMLPEPEEYDSDVLPSKRLRGYYNRQVDR